MKYFLKDDFGREIKFKPSDDDGPDHVLWVTINDENDEENSGFMYLKVSQLYEFMEWLSGWAPDPREKK